MFPTTAMQDHSSNSTRAILRIAEGRPSTATRIFWHGLLAAVILASAFRAAPAWSYASSLDPTFGQLGLVRQAGLLEGPVFGEAVAFDAQDRIIVAGTMCDHAYTRCYMVATRYDDRGAHAGPFGLYFAYTQFDTYFDAPIARWRPRSPSTRRDAS